MTEYFKPASQAREETDAEKITEDEVRQHCRSAIDTAIRRKKYEARAYLSGAEGVKETAFKVAAELEDSGYKASCSGEKGGTIIIDIRWTGA